MICSHGPAPQKFVEHLPYDALRIGADGQDDVLNGGKQSVQGGRGWMAAQLAGISQSYIEGHLEIVVDVPRWGGGADYQLVLVYVPDGGYQCLPHKSLILDGVHAKSGNVTSYLARDLVFVRTGSFAELGQEVVPALVSFPCWVRLTPKKRRVNFIRVALFETPHKVIRICSEGKINQAGVGFGDCLDASDGGLVEGVSEIANGCGRNMPDSPRNPPGELNFERLVSGFRVYINDTGATIALEKSFASDVELGEIFLSLRD
ncbi:hypothetical protein [Mesorhizobium sp. NZP2298]|uniref:hypothetical protein n=1 Tax=Mesorhizobium sp. NZP2298 TaxID=2483403 RepID=UPI001551CFFD|nr:hypothetical protein [Mesorhizobium sp. NZP2298]